MRVLHLLKTSVGATWALRQVRELLALGVEVHVALPPGGPLLAAYAAAGAVVHLEQLDFPARGMWRYAERARRLRALVDGVGPDLVHSHFVGTTLTMRLALGRAHPTPRVFQVPGPLHLEHAVFRRAEIATAGPLDWWIGSCRWTVEEYLRSGIPADRVGLSYYGADIDGFGSAQRGKLRRELGVRGGSRLVGMVGYMYAPKRYLGQRRGLKGHEDLIDATARCDGREPPFTTVFIGGAWDGANAYERRVRAYAARRCGDRAVFLGTRSDVADLYPDLDVLAIPSRSENVGGAVESLLAGAPTVATRVGGLPDLVEDGETGWLVPPRDPAALAAALLAALADPDEARARAARGRLRAREMFDCRRTAREVLGIYESVVAAASGRSGR